MRLQQGHSSVRLGSTGVRHSVATALFGLVGVGLGANGVLVALDPARIGSTYGLEPQSGNLRLLLRHRAVMLAVLGLLLLASAARPQLRPAAATAGGSSMAAFVLFAATSEVTTQQRAVARADVVLLLGLITAGALTRRSAGRQSDDA